MKKSSKSVLIILILIFILTSVVEIYLLQNMYESELKERFNYDLELIADKKAAQVNIFLESKLNQISILSKSTAFVNALNNPNNISFINQALERVISLKEVSPGIGLVSINGTVLAAEDFPLGFSYSSHPYFSMKEKGIYFDRYYDPSRKGDYFGVISPIYSDNKKIIGFLFLDIPLSQITKIMSEDIKDNFTEVYLVDREKLLLSESKFIGSNDRKGILLQEVNSEPVHDCIEDMEEYGDEVYLEEHEEGIAEYINYMGDKVIGTHSYANHISGCIVAESNTDKMKIYNFQKVKYLTISLLPIFIFLLILFGFLIKKVK